MYSRCRSHARTDGTGQRDAPSDCSLPKIVRARSAFALTLLAARCYGIGMERATNHLPPNRKAREQERAYFKRLGELEETVPKFGSRPPRQLGEVLEELARHRARLPMLLHTDDLAEHLAEREAMMRKSDAGSAGMAE